ADVLAWWTGQPPDLQAASLDELMELGGVLAALNRVDDSAAVFYQAHRCFPSEARAHFGLVSIVLFRGESSWQTTTETLLKAGWAFGLRDDTGVEHTYVLEDMPERDLASDELTIR